MNRSGSKISRSMGIVLCDAAFPRIRAWPVACSVYSLPPKIPHVEDQVEIRRGPFLVSIASFVLQARPWGLHIVVGINTGCDPSTILRSQRRGYKFLLQTEAERPM